MKNFTKFFLLSAFVVFFWFFVFFLKPVFSLKAYFFPITFLLLSLAFFATASVCPVEVYFVIPAITLSSLSFLFLSGFSLSSAVLTLLCFVGFFLFLVETRKEVESRLNLSIGKSVDAGIVFFFLFVILGFTFQTFSTVADSNKPFSEFIPDGFYSFALSSTTNLFLSDLGCSTEMTLNSCLDKIASKEISKNLEQCNSFSGEEKSECVSQLSALLNERIEEYKGEIRQKVFSGVEESEGNKTLREILTGEGPFKRALKEKVNLALKPFRSYLPLFVSLIVFSTLNFISIPLGFLVKLLTELFVFLLLSLNFVNKKKVEVEIEVLE